MSESESSSQGTITCARCGERPAVSLSEGRGVCEECTSSPVSSTLQRLQESPLGRELTVLVGTAVGAAAIYGDVLGAAVVAVIVVAVAIAAPRFEEIEDVQEREDR